MLPSDGNEATSPSPVLSVLMDQPQTAFHCFTCFSVPLRRERTSCFPAPLVPPLGLREEERSGKGKPSSCRARVRAGAPLVPHKHVCCGSSSCLRQDPCYGVATGAGNHPSS